MMGIPSEAADFLEKKKKHNLYRQKMTEIYFTLQLHWLDLQGSMKICSYTINPYCCISERILLSKRLKAKILEEREHKRNKMQCLNNLISYLLKNSNIIVTRDLAAYLLQVMALANISV